jgi:hypothetical protein
VTLSAEDVLEQAAAWIWVPDYARTVAADGYLVIAYPDHFSEPTVVTAIDSTRAADDVIDAVMRDASSLDRTSVTFFDISDATRPPELEARLRELGAPLTERLAVLALDLTPGLPDLDVPGDVEVRPATTLDDLRAIDRIDTTVFGGTGQSDEALAESLAGGGAEGRAVAWRDGVPVGAAGHVVVDGTLRLWGGAVVPEARRTGAYRALLAHRLRAGAEAGATMALVKGRVDTSAPVLLRAGFRQYGEVRAYRLDRPHDRH